MLHLYKNRQENNRWAWQIGRVALARAYPDSDAPGLFLFSISGVHRPQAELFSTHLRAEALLRRHLGCDIKVELRPVAQSIAIRRDEDWHKLEPGLPPEQESDTYTYSIGNVLIASLTNIKSIRENGYHLFLPLASGSTTTRVVSIPEAEQLLTETLECKLAFQPGAISYAVGPNHQPGQAGWFSCQPRLYDGRPAR